MAALAVLREPALLIATVALVFAAVIGWLRLDLTITRDARWEAGQRKAQAAAAAQKLAVLLSGVHSPCSCLPGNDTMAQGVTCLLASRGVPQGPRMTHDGPVILRNQDRGCQLLLHCGAALAERARAPAALGAERLMPMIYTSRDHDYARRAERRRGLAQLERAAEVGDADRLAAAKASVEERLKATTDKVCAHLQMLRRRLPLRQYRLRTT